MYWFLNAVGACSLLLVVINIVLFTGNRALQQEVSARQRYINDSIRLNRLNSQLIRLVAETSAKTGDQQLRDLLAANGVTFQVTQSATDSAPEATNKRGVGTE